MQRNYTNFQNKVLFEELKWEKTYTLDQPERGKKYLPLPIYKQITQLEQANQKYQKEKRELEQQLESNIWQHLDWEALKKLQQKLYVALDKENDDLYLQVIDRRHEKSWFNR